MSTSQNIAHKNEALHGYVSPRVGKRELYRLEMVCTFKDGLELTTYYEW